MENKTFQSIHVSSLTECGQWCLRDRRCLSINYAGSMTSQSESAICELNNSTKKGSNGLKNDARFTFYQVLNSVGITIKSITICYVHSRMLEDIVNRPPLTQCYL